MAHDPPDVQYGTCLSGWVVQGQSSLGQEQFGRATMDDSGGNSLREQGQREAGPGKQGGQALLDWQPRIEVNPNATPVGDERALPQGRTGQDRELRDGQAVMVAVHDIDLTQLLEETVGQRVELLSAEPDRRGIHLDAQLPVVGAVPPRSGCDEGGRDLSRYRPGKAVGRSLAAANYAVGTEQGGRDVQHSTHLAAPCAWWATNLPHLKERSGHAAQATYPRAICRHRTRSIRGLAHGSSLIRRAWEPDPGRRRFADASIL